MTVKFLVASLMIGLSGAAVASPELPRHALRFVNYGSLLMLIGLMFVELDIATGVLGLAVAKKTMRIASVLLAISAVLQMLIF